MAEVVVLPCVPATPIGALRVDDRAEHLGALHDPDAAAARRVDLGVLALDGGGDHDQVVAVDVRGVVSDGDGDAAPRPAGRWPRSA